VDARTTGLVLAFLALVLAISFVRRKNRKRLEVAALCERIHRFARVGRIEEAVTACDELLARFGDAADPEIRETLVKTLLVKCGALTTLGRCEEALHILEESRSTALQLLGRFGEAMLVFDEGIANFGNAPEFVGFFVLARFGKSACLAQLGRREEAIRICDEIIAAFGEEADSWPVESPFDPTRTIIQEGVAQATFLKGTALGELGRKQESRAAFEELSKRFSHAKEPGIRDIVAKAKATLHDEEAPIDTDRLVEAAAPGNYARRGADITGPSRPLRQTDEPTSSEATTRVTMGMYLDEDGEERSLEVPGWVGVVPNLVAANVDALRMVGQFYIERPYRDLASAPTVITAVDLRTSDGKQRMVQEFAGHIEDQAEVRNLVRQRLGPEMAHWMIVTAHIFKRS
jgi:tetratricopeptide (TPR) repeat protein